MTDHPDSARSAICSRTPALAAFLLLMSACGGGSPRSAPEDFGPETVLDIGVCDPEAGAFSLELDHEYLPFAVGNSWSYRGLEDGVPVELSIEVLDETEIVAGVTTRVVQEIANEGGVLHEVARNFFARAPDGNVCYFGEDVTFYEDGRVLNHEGEWRAGVDGALPGIALPAEPAVGMSYDQEAAPGVSEDHAQIVRIGEPYTVPAGTFPDTLDTKETSPLDPDVVESKRYARGVGLIVSGPLLLESRR